MNKGINNRTNKYTDRMTYRQTGKRKTNTMNKHVHRGASLLLKFLYDDT